MLRRGILSVIGILISTTRSLTRPQTEQNTTRQATKITLLFIDTESDPKTKEPLCIQTGWNNHFETIKDFTHEERLSCLWNDAEAVILYNAPYDMGVISSVYENSYVWDGTFWKMNIFGGKYKVRKDTRTQKHSQEF